MPNDEYDSPIPSEDEEEKTEAPEYSEDEDLKDSEQTNPEDAEESEAPQKKSISADLIRGHINTIILRSLFEGDRYGYDIIDEIEQKSHGQYQLKQPTLYSALKRLERQGYVKSYWGGVSNGGRRRYFSLTDEGRDVVKQNQAEWEYSRTIIDNLISEKDFDFSNPAPQKLDFRILRQSTSRTPIVTEEMLANPEYAGELTIIAGDARKDGLSEPESLLIRPEEKEPVSAETSRVSDGSAQPAADSAATQQIPQAPEQVQAQTQTASQSILPEQSPEQTQTQAQTQEQAQMQSPTPTQPEPQTQTQSQSQPQTNTNANSSLPLFSSLSEQERNYKEIIASIYRKAIKPQPKPIYTPPPAPAPEPVPVPPQTPPAISVEQTATTAPTEINQTTPVSSAVETERQAQQIQQIQLPQQPSFTTETTNSIRETAQVEYAAPLQNQNTVNEVDYSTREAQAETSATRNTPPPPPYAFIEKESVQSVQPEQALHEIYKEEKKAASGKIDFYDIVEQARYDGLRVWTSEPSKEKKSLPEDFFNKGLTLLQASLVFFFIAILESVFVILFKNKLFVQTPDLQTPYIVVMLVCSLAVPLVCACLYLSRYQPCCKRFRNNTVIYNSIVLFIVLFILLIIIDLLIDFHLTDKYALLLYLIIPGVFLLNIFVFSVSYFLLSKNKKIS